MTEVLCARTPAVLHSADIKRAVDFYRDAWGFTLHQQVPGTFAILLRESVTVHLWQRLADMPVQTFACRLLVDSIEVWQSGLQSAPGQMPHAMADQPWGRESGLSDGDGNRLLLVQSAPHTFARRTRA